MREIKFRGKSIDTKEWVYGSLVHAYTSSSAYRNIGYHISFITEERYVETHEIIPKTVGQLIGLNDKAKEEIYESDIIKVKDARKDEGFGNYEVLFDWRGAGIMVDEIHIGLDMLSQVEVIGNMHENPKLL